MTSATALEEGEPLLTGEETLSKLKDTTTKKTKETMSNFQEIELPDNLHSTGVETDEIKEYHPKEETIEVGLQTRDHLDQPLEWDFKPTVETEDFASEIKKGDLFDFDEEVEPIVNVLLYKTLEESRMEVLEEEEIKEMKQQELEFEKIRNRELIQVQKLENREKRRNEEIDRRNIEKEISLQMRKIFHQKLISRVYSKNLLNHLTHNTLSALKDQGLLKNPLINEYQTKLLPLLYSQNETVFNEEQTVLDEVDSLFDQIYVNQTIHLHKFSVQCQKEKLEELERQRQEEEIRKEEEKQRRREERARKKHEKELEALKTQIKEELFKDAEFVDDFNNFSNNNGYHIKSNKTLSLIGGHFVQMSLFVLLFKNEYSDIFDNYHASLSDDTNKEAVKTDSNKEDENSVDSDLIYKFIDLYLVKCKPFIMLYTNEQFEQIKTLDPSFASLTSLEDIFKLESQDNYLKIVDTIIDNNINNDELFSVILDSFEQSLNISNVLDFIKSIYIKLFTIIKASTDYDPKEKVKFILTEKTDINKDYYFGICNINNEIIPKQRSQMDITQQLLAKKNKKNDKMNRPYFEPFYQEKLFICNLSNEKMKILVFNDIGERTIRMNMFDCISRLSKNLEERKEEIMENINNKYNTFAEAMKSKVLEIYEKEMLNMNITSADLVSLQTPASA